MNTGVSVITIMKKLTQIIEKWNWRLDIVVLFLFKPMHQVIRICDGEFSKMMKSRFFDAISVWYFARKSLIQLILGLVVCPELANSFYFFKNNSGKFWIFILISTFLHDETIFFIPVCFYVYIYAYRVLEMIVINFCP